MDLAVKKLIENSINYAVTIALDAINAKHKEKMLTLQKIIQRFLLLRKFFFSILLHNHNASLKTYSSTNFLIKITRKIWNKANLSYFDPYLNRAYRENKRVLKEKDVYYRHVMFFVQRR